MERLIAQARSNLAAGIEADADINPADWEKLLCHYSDFADGYDAEGYISSSEVVVHDFNTPRPSLHLMTTNHTGEYGTWGTFWDQFGGGFSCLDSVLAGKMTSHLDSNYVPTAPEPQDARLFFIHEQGKAWAMFPPANFVGGEYERTECRHGMDYHIIEADKNGIATKLTVTVSPDKPLEVMTIELTNHGSFARKILWFMKLRVNVDSFPFYYFVPRVVCEGILEDGAMVFLNHDKSNKHSRHAFFTAEPAFDGFDMMGEAFDGIGGRAEIPAAVRRGKCTDSLGLQPYAGLIAAAQFNAELLPGESRTWTVAYGGCPYNKDERRQYVANVKENVLNTDTAAQVRAVWREKIERMKIKTPSAEIDRYYNIWSRYQARNQVRFVRALDKVGYRDILQDLLGVCETEPEYVRTMLRRTLCYQMLDGQAIRQYEKFPNSGHDLRMYMDSASWIPDLLNRYLKETGDFAFLDEVVPYFNRETLAPDPACSGTVYEHALRAVQSMVNVTGHHGLCRIGYGDWNDALSGIGGENGVSVWLSCACVFAAGKMAEIARHLGKSGDEAQMREIIASMTDKINAAAWDGQWYVYALNDQVKPVGSASNSEGKLHLNVNTWALFTGVAGSAGREADVWAAVETLDTPCGHCLLRPPYSQLSRSAVGRIADQKAGMFENGSIYIHGEAFYLYALIRGGHSDKCYERLLQMLPSAQVQDIASGPRHQQSNFTVGPDDHDNFGMQLFSNFTGSLAWFRRVIEEMVGVYPNFEELVVKPMPPSAWNDGYEVRKIWRKRKIRVVCRHQDNVKTIATLNGVEYSEGRIPVRVLAMDEENVITVNY